MKTDLCICDRIPYLDLKTKVVMIVGRREARVPTNTGRLAALALPNSVILIRGDLDNPYQLLDHLPSDYHPLLLYPSSDAVTLTSELVATFKKPVVLVVPDGNWRQTNKMRKRDPAMAALSLVKLAPGPASAYKVRKENQTEGLATIEAIARALGVLEGPVIQKQLEDLLKVMVARTLTSRGIALAQDP